MNANRWLVALTLALSAPVSATLIGDEIDARWQFGSFDQTSTFIVGPGPEGDLWFSVTLDIMESAILIDFMPGTMAWSAGTTWTFSDLDWVGTPGRIVDVIPSSNWDGWSNDFVSFGDDFIEVNFLSDITLDSMDDFLLLEIETEHLVRPVPEPATVSLFLIGLAGLLARKRYVA